MNNQLAHLIVTIAALVFCGTLYLYGGLQAQGTALTFAGIILGYWFGVYKPVTAADNVGAVNSLLMPQAIPSLPKTV